MRRIIWLVLLLLVLSGCSNRWGYRFADTLIEWRIDDYVTLTSAQSSLISADIDRLHLWHAQTQLPIYQQELLALRDLIIADQLDAEQIAAINERMYGWWQNIRVEIEPYAQNYLPQLSVKQRQELLASLQEQLEEQRERAEEMSWEDVQKRSLERMEDNLENFIGRLESGQRRYLRRWLGQRQDTRALWLDYQQLWLTTFSEVLNELDAVRYQQRIRALMLAPEQMRSVELQQALEEGRQATHELLLSLYQSLTPKQRHRLIREIDSYLGDLDTLITDFADRPKP